MTTYKRKTRVRPLVMHRLPETTIQIATLEHVAMWLGKMIADGAHQNCVMPRDCERTLQMVEKAIDDARVQR